jgi:hypothetical protein
VLNLDADEALSPELKAEIALSIERDELDGLESPLIEKFLGVPNHRWTRRNYRIRFFRRSKGHYDDVQVHESIVVDGRVARSKGGIYHDGVPTIEEMLRKTVAYARLKADEKFARGRRSSLAKMVLVFPVMFVKSYFLKRHLLNGRRGLIGAMNNAFYAFLKEAMLYEKELQQRLRARRVSKQKDSHPDGSSICGAPTCSPQAPVSGHLPEKTSAAQRRRWRCSPEKA